MPFGHRQMRGLRADMMAKLKFKMPIRGQSKPALLLDNSGVTDFCRGDSNVPEILTEMVKALNISCSIDDGIYRTLVKPANAPKQLVYGFLNGALRSFEGIDPSVIALCLVEFMNRLSQPLIEEEFYWRFINLSEADSLEPLCNEIKASLPPQNKHTLAYLMAFFNRLIPKQNNKLPRWRITIQDLAEIFAPSIVGFGSMPVELTKLPENRITGTAAMLALFRVEKKFWASIVNIKIPKAEPEPEPEPEPVKVFVPSHLIHYANRSFITPLTLRFSLLCRMVLDRTDVAD